MMMKRVLGFLGVLTLIATTATIVTIATMATQPAAAQLASRPPDDPNSRPVAVPDPSARPDAMPTRSPDDPNARPNAIPEGTTFTIRLRDTLDTSRIRRGQHFQADVQEDLVAPNEAMIPRGHRVEGHVSDYDRGLHGRLILSFDKIETRHGWVPLSATVISVPGEHGVNPSTGEEGEISRRTVDKNRTIEDAAVGAGLGALAGAIVAGGKGAAIGAAIGAAGGTGTGILTARDIRIEKGQALELRLDRPIILPSH